MSYEEGADYGDEDDEVIDEDEDGSFDFASEYSGEEGQYYAKNKHKLAK
jgi:hypothetical protein